MLTYSIYVNIEGYKFGGWTGPIWASSEVGNRLTLMLTYSIYVNIEGYKFGGWIGPIRASCKVGNRPALVLINVKI